MAIRVVTDSTCDLPDELVKQYGIRVLPMYIHVGETEYLDGVSMSREQFYGGLPEFPRPPTTAAPGIDAFLQAYEELVEQGATGIVSVHIAESLSNVVNVARVAAQRVEGAPVRVIDSGQLTLGVGLQALAAAELAAEGGTMQEVEAIVRGMIARSHTFAALATVEFLKRSGRLSQFQAGLATVLRILPLLKMHKGVAEMEKIRTREKGVKRLVQLLRDLGPLEQLAVVHTNAPQEAAALLQGVHAWIPPGIEPLHAQVTPVIGAHIGPGAVGFVAVARR
jgi:DegV family protein with EDD domain